MDGRSAWLAHYPNRWTTFVPKLGSYSEPDIIQNDDDDGDDTTTITISMDSLLPDDILERILALLPVASIFRAGSVCKRWHDIVKSRRFLWNFSTTVVPQKPWYFMFTCSDIPSGHAYDPIFRKWYCGFDLPCIESSSWIISSSRGLVCFMDSDSRSKIYVCNPITRRWRGIEEPPGVKCSYYTSLALSVDRNQSQSYKVAVAKSKQLSDDFLQYDFYIHVYDSDAGSWVTCAREAFAGWRGGDESVICNGILYCLIYSTGVLGNADPRHRLVTYDLSKKRSSSSLLRNAIPAPCPLTCGRLMNIRDKLVMVGGIGKHDRADIIKGIGIWELDDDTREWREVARMPHRFFQGFGEFDDVFASSGTNDQIYIQSYGAPALLVFDVGTKMWRWSQKCPVTKRFPLQLFTGFCFEPRLEVLP